MRLFVAIHFSEEVKNVLQGSIGQLKSQGVTANFTRPENLHLTLAFIGETDDIASIRESIDKAAAASKGPFELVIGGAGSFRDLWWVGIEKNPALFGLVMRLRTDLRAKKFDIERQAFRPHITIARQVECGHPIELEVPRTRMTVARVSLMKSERPGGVLTYTELYGKDLSAR